MAVFRTDRDDTLERVVSGDRTTTTRSLAHSMDQAEILARIAAYFTAEKRESVLFIVTGFTALVVSVALFRNGGAYRGMIIPPGRLCIAYAASP